MVFFLCIFSFLSKAMCSFPVFKKLRLKTTCSFVFFCGSFQPSTSSRCWKRGWLKFTPSIHPKHSSSTQAPWTWHLDLKDVLGLEGVAGPSSPSSPSTAPALGSIKGVASLEEMERVGKPDPLMRSLDELGMRFLGNHGCDINHHLGDGWTQRCSIFFSSLGGNDPIWRAYISDGMKPPSWNNGKHQQKCSWWLMRWWDDKMLSNSCKRVVGRIFFFPNQQKQQFARKTSGIVLQKCGSFF